MTNGAGPWGGMLRVRAAVSVERWAYGEQLKRKPDKW
jgi:hypothetical protein